MTQAFNLSQLANNLNTAGQLDATDGLTGAVPVANGGTGLTSTPSNGQIDIGNGSGFTRATLTAGSGIAITNGSGSITIATSGAGGVTSVNGQTGAVTTTDYGGIGTYTYAYIDLPSPASYNPGLTYAGSALRRNSDESVNGNNTIFNMQSDPNYAGLVFYQANTTTGLGLSGTWRLMTRIYNAINQGGANSRISGLFVRIS